ncbi:MAG: hypothetical protein LBT55_07455 [Clostridiaceae bacterium]|jgi:hypothetical protein|nr:hypothetical protein [Clostridiaceae bacterium]
MTIKQLLGNVLRKLGYEDFTAKTVYGADEEEMIDKLLYAADSVYKEIRTCYLPIEFTENVTTDANGFLPYSTLSRNIIAPRKLTVDGKEKGFVGGATGLKTSFVGGATLTYAYMPDALTLEGDTPGGSLPDWVLEEGTAGEYAFREGLYDVASAFDGRFRESMARIKYRGGYPKIPARRWGL